VCDENIFDYNYGVLKKIQVIDMLDGFSCGAVNDNGTLVYAMPEYLRLHIFQWSFDNYQKTMKIELGQHMGSKKQQGILNFMFMPESTEEFLCIVGKCLRKSSLKN
jgi:hypothetical protein